MHQFSSRRVVVLVLITVGVALASFNLGAWDAHRRLALQQTERDARIDALRAEMVRSFGLVQRQQQATAAGTSGEFNSAVTLAGRDLIVDEVKRQLQAEMGLVPLQTLKRRRGSFVELYAYDAHGRANYGTAGYLGDGYFITVKHGVIALQEPEEARRNPRKITSVKLIVGTRRVSARIVDAGDANIEVHSGDWAILKVKEPLNLPALDVNTAFAFDFADPIFRLGNDYSKGIVLASGYVGQHTGNGLVTALTDGHPGVSGGGVLDQTGSLVGIPVGRMQGDYRFSFILPLRGEMFRRVPHLRPAVSGTAD